MTCLLVSYLLVICKINNSLGKHLSILDSCLLHLTIVNFSCWLSPVGGAIWGFVGPAVAVIGVSPLFMSVKFPSFFKTEQRLTTKRSFSH